MMNNVEHDVCCYFTSKSSSSSIRGEDSSSLPLLKGLPTLEPSLHIRRGANQQRRFQGLSPIREQQDDDSPSMLDSTIKEHRPHLGRHHYDNALKCEELPRVEVGRRSMTCESATRAMIPSKTTFDDDAGSEGSSCSSGSGSGDEVFVAFITGNGDGSSLPTPPRCPPATFDADGSESSSSSTCSSGSGSGDEVFVAYITTGNGDSTSVPKNPRENFKRKIPTRTSFDDDDDSTSKSSGSGSGQEVFVAEITGTNALPQRPPTTIWITPDPSTTAQRPRKNSLWSTNP